MAQRILTYTFHIRNKYSLVVLLVNYYIPCFLLVGCYHVQGNVHYMYIMKPARRSARHLHDAGGPNILHTVQYASWKRWAIAYRFREEDAVTGLRKRHEHAIMYLCMIGIVICYTYSRLKWPILKVQVLNGSGFQKSVTYKIED
jgi:uncharacterized membrane protein YhdT